MIKHVKLNKDPTKEIERQLIAKIKDLMKNEEMHKKTFFETHSCIYTIATYNIEEEKISLLRSKQIQKSYHFCTEISCETVFTRARKRAG